MLYEGEGRTGAKRWLEKTGGEGRRCRVEATGRLVAGRGPDGAELDPAWCQETAESGCKGCWRRPEERGLREGMAGPRLQLMEKRGGQRGQVLMLAREKGGERSGHLRC
jgi:hypothetical protein